MDYKKLGAAIGAALKKFELSAIVGEFCGVTKNTVNGWIYAGARPDDKNQSAYFRLIKALKIDVSEFADVETVGGRITFLRFKNELNISDLQKACGKKSGTQFCQYELGTRIVSAKIAGYLAVALNTTADYILFGDKKVEPLRNGLMGTTKDEVERIENGATPFSIGIYIKNIGNDEVNAVNARELWAKLAVGRDFSNWIKQRVEKYDFVEGTDYAVANFGDGESSGFQSIDYFISLDMAKELSMVENNEQGKQARRYFIACEKTAKSAPLPTVGYLSPEVLFAMKSARGFAKLSGASKHDADRFVNEETQRIFGINAIQLVTGGRNEQLRLRIVK